MTINKGLRNVLDQTKLKMKNTVKSHENNHCWNNIQDISAKHGSLLEWKINEFKHNTRKTSTSNRRISNGNMINLMCEEWIKFCVLSYLASWDSRMRQLTLQHKVYTCIEVTGICSSCLTCDTFFFLVVKIMPTWAYSRAVDWNLYSQRAMLPPEQHDCRSHKW